MKKWLRRLSRLEIVLIFLVIIAGSVVRSTGSGMGCPDWPKCFGYLIPPTERAELEWQAQREFKKGQIIIIDEALYSARSSFISGEKLDPQRWEAYTKHDYALFNPLHTWIEYINRLLGALSGLPMLLLVILSAFCARRDWRPLVLSLAGLFMLGFEAWLGKLVVDGNLIPGSITIHMMGALLIVALLLVLNGIVAQERLRSLAYTARFKQFLILAVLLSLLQIVLGTQVREQIDHFQKLGLERSTWMGELDLLYYIHRSFSLVLLGLNGWLIWQNRRLQLGFWQMPWIALVLSLEILVGVILAYFDLPAFAQPLHLVLGALLFALQMQALVHFSLTTQRRLIRID